MERIVKKLAKKQRLFASILLGLQLPGCLALAAPAEPWVYDSLGELAAAGYLKMPDRPLDSYSREELAGMVSKALADMEEKRTGSLADEYALLTKLEVMDEVQLKLAKEQEHFAQEHLSAAKDRAKRAAEMLVRRSIEGQNRLEIMTPLKEKNDAAQEKLSFAARDYAEAKSRVVELAGLLQQVQQRQRKLLEDMSGMAGDGNAVVSSATAGKGAPSLAGKASRPVQPAALGTGSQGTGAAGQADSALAAAGRLRAEFAGELEQKGSLDEGSATRQLSSNLPLRKVPDQRFKVDAELRLDSRNSSGDHGNGSRTRLRTRVYPDYNIDGNWHLMGMLEWEKTLAGEKSGKDGRLKFDRYYLSGDIGTVHADLGVFGSNMAEGNIYDSKFKGARFSVGRPVRYTLEAGKVGRDGVKNSFDLTASYKGPDYGIDGGIYRFGFEGGSWQNIYMANYRHNLGVFDASAMLLYGKEKDKGGKAGYVLTLGYNPADSWKPYTWNGWLKYYYQPSSTYLYHTMNGLADVLKLHGGFRGWGVGFAYNLPHDWSVGLEYYALRDLDYGHSANTIWGYVSKSFKNYSE